MQISPPELRGGPRRGGRLLAVALVAVGAISVAAAALSVVGSNAHRRPTAASVTSSPAQRPPSTPSDPLGQKILAEQSHLRSVPADHQAWARLGLDYVQQAKVTVDPTYYPKAADALQRSLDLNSATNYLAMAGESALNAAEHNFAAAQSWAQRGLAINPNSSTLYGALADADTQLGQYSAAFEAVQKMNDLDPGVPAFTRAEYVFELRGDIPGARAALDRARAEATSPADKAFISYYMAELAFNSGDPTTALAEDEAGLRADPSYRALVEGKAKAEAALGMSDAAVADYLKVVAEVPQPQYVIEAGELLQSLGRNDEAQKQYDLFGVENKLFESNGVTLDTDPSLFYADHGNPELALRFAETGIKIRPFIEMDDAYAWALHANHRDAEARDWETKAMQLGTRNALFYFHAGMIELALGNAAGARADLRTALAINPHFSPYHERTARSTLAQLETPP